jgi:cytochrome c oxidase subunit IV
MTSQAQPGHSAGHSGAAAAHHEEPNYMGVFIALAVLTVVEIAVVFMPIPKIAVGSMLVILAFTKAVLVAAYFMHLKFERRTLAIIAATPIVLCVMLMFALLPDSDPGKVKHPPAPPATAAHS